EDGIRDFHVTGVQTCALPILPQNAGEHLIKRIIGMGGDTVECCDDEGRLTVNGVGIDEPYLKPGVSPSDTEFSVTVPENHLWLRSEERRVGKEGRCLWARAQ